MKNKWLALLKQLEIIKPIPGLGEEKWTEEELLAFESETNIILPDEYKSFCQIFGSGGFGNYININCPYLQISNYYNDKSYGGKNTLSGLIRTNNPSTISDTMSFYNLLHNGFYFGTRDTSDLFFWDLRTYSEIDKSYDIYITRNQIYYDERLVYKICRSFYQFVVEFCLGTKSYEILPPDLYCLPEDLTLTFFPFSTKLLHYRLFKVIDRPDDNEPTDNNEITNDNEDCSPPDNFQHLCLPYELFDPDGDSQAGRREKAETYQSIKDKHPYAFFRYLKTFKGHLASVYAVKFSSDGKTLISASADTTIKLWNLTTNQESFTLRGHTMAVISLAVSPNGLILASGSADSTIKLWDLHKALEIKTLAGHTNSVLSLAISSDGKTLVSGSADNTIKIWNLENCHLIRTLEGHYHSILSVAISPDGKLLASGSADSTLKLWDLSMGKLLCTLDRDNYFVFAVCFHPHQELLISLDGNKMIKSWCLSTKKLFSTIKTSDTFFSMAISPSGQMLAASHNIYSTIKLWDLSTGKCTTSFENFNDNFIYHKELIYNLTFSPDGKLLASGSKDKTIKLWGIPAPINIE